MKIAVIDPWCFTPPYNRELCTALATTGHEVTMVGQHDGNDDPTAAGNSPAVAKFTVVWRCVRL